jgi:FkbM family methyltransferase
VITNIFNQGFEAKKIIIKDIYKVHWIKDGALDFVFDIGANIGLFSVMMRARHPRARIVAVEPAIDARVYLRLNVQALNIDIVEKAIGDGNPLNMKSRGHILDTIFTPLEQNGGYAVESIKLKTLMDMYGCKSSNNYLIKLNCEGGETFLLNDPESIEILKNAYQVSMQAHYRSVKTPFEEWPEEQEYKDKVKSIFTYHKIKWYHMWNKTGTVQCYMVKR